MFWRERHLKDCMSDTLSPFWDTLWKTNHLNVLPSSSFYFYLSLSFPPRCQMCSNGLILRLTFIYNERKWLWKKHNSVYPIQLQRNRQMCFFPHCFLIFFWICTLPIVASTLWYYRCAVENLIILGWKPNSAFSTALLRLFSNAALS